MEEVFIEDSYAQFQSCLFDKNYAHFMAEPFILLPVRFRWIKVRLPKIVSLTSNGGGACGKEASRLPLVHSWEIDRY